MDSVRLGVSECPVCGTEYVEGEDTFCQTCGWDVTPIPVSHTPELAEAVSQHDRTKLFWARKMWEQAKETESTLKQLEWKLADIEGQISKVWERFDRAGKERTQFQEQVKQVLLKAEESRQDRDRLERQIQQEREERQSVQQQLEMQLRQVLERLEQADRDRSRLQEQRRQEQWGAESMNEAGLTEILAKMQQDIARLAPLEGIGESERLWNLKMQLEESDRERSLLGEKLEKEQQQTAALRAQVQALKQAQENSERRLKEAEYESEMITLLVSALADPSEAVQRLAYSLLKRSQSPKAQMALEDYQPYRFFRCLQVVEHQKAVRALAISPDGNFLASGSNDKTIKVWEMNAGKLIKTLIGHNGSAIAVAISPNGELLASGSGDNTIKVWHLKAGKLLFTLRGHTGWVNAVAFSPKGNLLASGGADKTIALWNLDTQELVNTFYGHTSTVRSVAISPQGNMLVSGGNDNMIKIRNLLTGELLHTLTEHTGSVCSVAISCDGNILASGSNDTTLRLWNLGTGKLMHTLSDHSSGVTSVSISQNNTIASSSDDGTIKIWSLEKARVIHTIPPEKTTHGYEGYMLCSAIGPEGDKIVTGFDEGKIKIWGIYDH